ncbi:uncharacterized protein LOC125946815 [Dermacentor silvarum]|uniref:uncharacterized protein LOC125946815 n=1 Tax=Dermacentor silvarum TaxID=543639 RepID=UPI002101BC8D|nr:uncharacterized protein LOC125946815 [Dermacentor silvarum]
MPLHRLCIAVFLCMVVTSIICSHNDEDNLYDSYEDTSSQKNEYEYHRTNDGTNHKKGGVVLDIVKFMNTTEPIWVYNSSQSTQLSCKVDVVHNITNNSSYITRYYLSNESVNHYTFLADLLTNTDFLDHTEMPNEMKVINEECDTQFETLTYQSLDNKCAVFLVNFGSNVTDSPQWYELRVKNSSLASGPNPECIEEYVDALSTRQTSHFNYSSQCECIFQ